MSTPGPRDFHTFHQLDTIKTPSYEWAFMLVATTLLLLGLPIAIAAVIHFVPGLLGQLWGG